MSTNETMTKEALHAADEPLGIAYVAASYVLWGFVPLYWAMLLGVPPVEITLHRILWGAAVRCRHHCASRTLGRDRAHLPRPRDAERARDLERADRRELDGLHLVRRHASARRVEPRLLSDAAGLHGARRADPGRARVAAEARSDRDWPAWPSRCRRSSSAIYPGSRRRWRCPSASTAIMRKRTPVDALDGLTLETSFLLSARRRRARLPCAEGHGRLHLHQSGARPALDRRRSGDAGAAGAVRGGSAPHPHDDAGLPAISLALDHAAWWRRD